MKKLFISLLLLSSMYATAITPKSFIGKTRFSIIWDLCTDSTILRFKWSKIGDTLRYVAEDNIKINDTEYIESFYFLDDICVKQVTIFDKKLFVLIKESISKS